MAVFTGTSSNDTLIGAMTDDVLTGAGGDDVIDGGAGVDTAVFFGGAAEYQFGQSASFLVVTDQVTAGGDDGADSLVRIYRMQFSDRAYTINTESQVNTTTVGDQRHPSSTSLSDGGYLVVWQSPGQDGSGSGIYSRRFSPTGSALGTDVLLNETVAGDQLDADVATLANGDLVAVWTSNGQDGSLGGVYARILDATGTPQGGEFQVNSWFADDQGHAQVAALDGGGFAVCWTSHLQDLSGDGVYTRAYTAGGVGGTVARANDFTVGDQKAPVITGLDDGGYLVVWQSLQQDGSNFGVFGQRFNANGVAQATELQLNTTMTGNQLAPSVAGLAGGGAVVVWASQNQDGSGYGIFGRLVDASGAPAGSEFAVNTTTAKDQDAPVVSVLDDGRFMVAWESHSQDGSGFGVYARTFQPDGTPAGAEFRANATSMGHQLTPTVTALDGGGAAVSWISVLQDGDLGGVFTQMFDASGGVTGPIMIQGTTGDDTFDVSGNGPLQVAGLAGNDTYVVNEAADQLFEGPNAGVDTVNSSVSWTLGGGFENLVLLGNVPVSGFGNASDNSLTGNARSNTLDGGAGVDTLAGGAGNEVYYLDDADVVIEPVNSGFDTVYVTLSGTAPANVEVMVLTTTIDAQLVGNSRPNRITGNIGDDDIKGNFGDDTLQGGAGADTLTGGTGLDELEGDTGDDYYIVGAGDLATDVTGGGYDIVQSDADWTLGADFEELLLTGTSPANGTGNASDNRMTGSNAVNTLAGDAGNDLLDGRLGADVVSGGAGIDTLIGGGGGDAFLFDAALSITTNVDVVQDFLVTPDRVWLDDDVFTAFNHLVSTGVTNAQFYKAAGATAAHDASDRVVYDTTSGNLYYDPDGINGAPAVLFATLGIVTHPTVFYTSFVIVD